MHHTNKIFILPEMKAADIITGNPYLLLMLEHLGINMEVREKTITQICDENSVSAELFLTIANLFNGFRPSHTPEYNYGDIQAIVSYLNNSHKYYLQEKYPQMQQYIDEFNRINSQAEVLMIGKFFDEYIAEVKEHLNYEDDVVFPYVINLNNSLKNNDFSNEPTVYSVTEYREHHDDIEEKLTDLKTLLIKYMPQKNDQQIRRKLLLCLFELEYDLNIHSQIEETLLIPMVEKMEQIAKTGR